MRLSIRWKLVLGVGLPILLIYLGGLTITLNSLRKRSIRDLETRASRLAARFAAEYDADLRSVEQLAKVTAASLGSQPDAPAGSVIALLSSVIEANEFVRSARVYFGVGSPGG